MKRLLNCLSIKMLMSAIFCLAFVSPPAVADEEFTRWHTKPISYKTLGSDVNNFYRVVGLPKNCICQFMAAQPAYSEHGHDFFYVSGHPKIFIEVEYSGERIGRFRFIEKSSKGLEDNRFGGWQTENIRQNASDFTTGISIVQLDMTKDRFEMPFGSMSFDVKKWKSDRQHRSFVLFDIAHDYSIIGMNRPELIAILGEPDNLPDVSSEVQSNFDYVDRYILTSGCLGVYSFLEIAYKDDKAVGYRVGVPDHFKRKPS